MFTILVAEALAPQLFPDLSFKGFYRLFFPATFRVQSLYEKYITKSFNITQMVISLNLLFVTLTSDFVKLDNSI